MDGHKIQRWGCSLTDLLLQHITPKTEEEGQSWVVTNIEEIPGQAITLEYGAILGIPDANMDIISLTDRLLRITLRNVEDGTVVTHEARLEPSNLLEAIVGLVTALALFFLLYKAASAAQLSEIESMVDATYNRLNNLEQKDVRNDGAFAFLKEFSGGNILWDQPDQNGNYFTSPITKTPVFDLFTETDANITSLYGHKLDMSRTEAIPLNFNSNGYFFGDQSSSMGWIHIDYTGQPRMTALIMNQTTNTETPVLSSSQNGTTIPGGLMITTAENAGELIGAVGNIAQGTLTAVREGGNTIIDVTAEALRNTETRIVNKANNAVSKLTSVVQDGLSTLAISTRAKPRELALPTDRDAVPSETEDISTLRGILDSAGRGAVELKNKLKAVKLTPTTSQDPPGASQEPEIPSLATDSITTRQNFLEKAGGAIAGSLSAGLHRARDVAKVTLPIKSKSVIVGRPEDSQNGVEIAAAEITTATAPSQDSIAIEANGSTTTITPQLDPQGVPETAFSTAIRTPSATLAQAGTAEGIALDAATEEAQPVVRVSSSSDRTNGVSISVNPEPVKTNKGLKIWGAITTKAVQVGSNALNIISAIDESLSTDGGFNAQKFYAGTLSNVAQRAELSHDNTKESLVIDRSLSLTNRTTSATSMVSVSSLNNQPVLESERGILTPAVAIAAPNMRDNPLYIERLSTGNGADLHNTGAEPFDLRLSSRGTSGNMDSFTTITTSPAGSIISRSENGGSATRRISILSSNVTMHDNVMYERDTQHADGTNVVQGNNVTETLGTDHTRTTGARARINLGLSSMVSSLSGFRRIIGNDSRREVGEGHTEVTASRWNISRGINGVLAMGAGLRQTFGNDTQITHSNTIMNFVRDDPNQTNITMSIYQSMLGLGCYPNDTASTGKVWSGNMSTYIRGKSQFNDPIYNSEKLFFPRYNDAEANYPYFRPSDRNGEPSIEMNNNSHLYAGTFHGDIDCSNLYVPGNVRLSYQDSTKNVVIGTNSAPRSSARLDVTGIARANSLILSPNSGYTPQNNSANLNVEGTAAMSNLEISGRIKLGNTSTYKVLSTDDQNQIQTEGVNTDQLATLLGIQTNATIESRLTNCITKFANTAGNQNKVVVTDNTSGIIPSTVTTTQLNQLLGINENETVQAQMNKRQNVCNGAISPFLQTNLTASRAMVSDASGKIGISAVSSTELGYSSGVTSAIQTQLNSKQNNITGGATTILTINLTASRALVSDLNGKVDAHTSVTTTELGYVNGVTSAIQTQLNSKQATITGGATTIVSTDLGLSKALVSDVSGKVAVSATTSTELGYVNGVTSAIQTQLNSKQATITGGATTIVSTDLGLSKALISDASGKVAVSTTSSTELGYVNGVTSAIQTQLNSKQATITGGATTIVSTDLGLSKALVSDASGKVAVSSTTSTELGYVNGVTSAIQTQLNSKQATITGGATTITSTNLGLSKALVSDASGKVAVSTTTSTELGYVNGVTSAIQTQLNSKQATVTGGATTIVSTDLGLSKALVSDASGKVAVSATTSTELGYVNGVTSAIQTQLNSKQATITGGATTIVSTDLGLSKALVSDASGKVAVSTTSSTELGYVNGVTSAIQTQLNSKQATITGGATTILSTNLTTSRALVSDLNGKVDAHTSVTTTELGYVNGVTSAIQTQLNNKQANITGGATTILTTNLTASRALVSDLNGKVDAHSSVNSTELGYVNGVTSAIQTQLNNKQATITGGATTIATTNLTASRALVSDLNGKVDAHTSVTTTELGYVNGVTSAIQTQLNNKQATITGGATTIATANLTASRALVSDLNGKVDAHSTVTTTELGYVNGVTTAIQTQLNNKQATINGAATTITTANLTASRALVSDLNGKVDAHSTVTTTELGYVNGVTSAIQTQLNARVDKASNPFSKILTTSGTGTVTFSDSIPDANIAVNSIGLNKINGATNQIVYGTASAGCTSSSGLNYTGSLLNTPAITVSGQTITNSLRANALSDLLGDVDITGKLTVKALGSVSILGATTMAGTLTAGEIGCAALTSTSLTTGAITGAGCTFGTTKTLNLTCGAIISPTITSIYALIAASAAGNFLTSLISGMVSGGSTDEEINIAITNYYAASNVGYQSPWLINRNTSNFYENPETSSYRICIGGACNYQAIDKFEIVNNDMRLVTNNSTVLSYKYGDTAGNGLNMNWNPNQNKFSLKDAKYGYNHYSISASSPIVSIPPVNITANTQTLTDPDGLLSGQYICYASSGTAFHAFDNLNLYTSGTSYSLTTPFDFIPASNLTALTIEFGGQSNLGEWVQLFSPVGIYPVSISYIGSNSGIVDSYECFGSITGSQSSWYSLGQGTTVPATITLSSNLDQAYRHFRFVGKSITTNSGVMRIAQLTVNGYKDSLGNSYMELNGQLSLPNDHGQAIGGLQFRNTAGVDVHRIYNDTANVLRITAPSTTLSNVTVNSLTSGAISGSTGTFSGAVSGSSLTTAGNVSAFAGSFTNNVTAVKFIGDGSLLTGLPSYSSGANSDWAQNGTSVWTNSSVGIGITNPSQKLQIYDATSLTQAIVRNDLTTGQAEVRVRNNNTTLTDLKMGVCGTAFVTSGFKTANSCYLEATSTVGLNIATSAGAIGLYTNGLERVDISSAGLIGINTSTPATRCHLNGDLHIQANSDAWNSTATKGLYFRYSTNGTQDGGYIQSINRSNGTLQKMFIQGSVVDFDSSQVVNADLSNVTMVNSTGSNLTITDSSYHGTYHASKYGAMYRNFGIASGVVKAGFNITAAAASLNYAHFNILNQGSGLAYTAATTSNQSMTLSTTTNLTGNFDNFNNNPRYYSESLSSVSPGFKMFVWWEDFGTPGVMAFDITAAVVAQAGVTNNRGIQLFMNGAPIWSQFVSANTQSYRFVCPVPAVASFEMIMSYSETGQSSFTLKYGKICSYTVT